MARAIQTANCLRRQPEFSRLDRSRRYFLVGLAFLIFLFLGSSICYISTHVKVVDIGYQIDKELELKQKLIEENKRLSLEIARLKSPTRIEKEAKENFGFALPKPQQIIYLSQLENLEPLKTSPQIAAAKTNSSTENKHQVSPSPSKNATTIASAVAPLHSAPPKKNTLVIARIVRESSPLKTAPAEKMESENASKKTKESIPAVLLDPMP